MVISILRAADVENADAAVVGVPFDRDASFGRGARNGPQAIADCLHRRVELFNRCTGTEPALDFEFGYELLDISPRCSIDAMVARVAERLERVDRFGLVLGGTHSVSIGALQALAGRVDPRSVTVLQIDAHLDLRDDDGDYVERAPSRLAHSCVMRRVHEMGFATCAVGVRTYARSERDYALTHGMPVFEWGCGREPTIERVLEAITTERVYLTVDVDGFDPAVMPATGTPVPGGISWTFGTELLQRVATEKNLIGADIVEVAPDGVSGQTEYAAAQICYDLLALKFRKLTAGSRPSQRSFFVPFPARAQAESQGASAPGDRAADPRPAPRAVRNVEYALRKLRKCQHLYLADTGDRGIGVFAARRFARNEAVVVDLDGDYLDQTMTYPELVEAGIPLDYPMQVARDLFRVPSGSIDDFTNHSCDPNTGIQMRLEGAVVVAIRDVEAGEEITFDYSTHLNNPYIVMECRCGAVNCRGIIGNFDTLPRDLQERYIKLGIVGDFVLEDSAAGNTPD